MKISNIKIKWKNIKENPIPLEKINAKFYLTDRHALAIGRYTNSIPPFVIDRNLIGLLNSEDVLEYGEIPKQFKY